MPRLTTASQEMLNLLMEQILGQKAAEINARLQRTGRNLEVIVKNALVGFDEAFHDRKVEVAARFGHLLGKLRSEREISR